MFKLRFKKRKAAFKTLTAFLVLAPTLTFTSLLSASVALAQSSSQANGFVISPVRSEITINKGRSQTVQLSVENPTNIATTVKAVVNDFVASNDESGSPRLILGSTTPLPANNFISLVSAIPNIQLAPLQKQYINVTIAVPANAASGGYYGAIRFVPANINQKSNVGLTASAGSLFLITVPGNLTEKADLVQLSAANSGGNSTNFLISGNVSVLTRIQNVGNIHIQPFGRIDITDMFGHQVQSFEFNSAAGNILPDSTRQFVNKLKTQHWFGRYKITANLAYQQGSGNLINASATFYYFPVWFLIAVVAAILIIIAVIYWLVTRRTRSKKFGKSKKSRH